MPAKGRKSFFEEQGTSAADDAARQAEVAALLQQPAAAVADVDVERIDPNPFQARRDFPGLDELAAAMKVQGFTTRLRVRPTPHTPGRYQLVYGERRWRAAKLAGLAAIPVEIAEHTDNEMVEIGLAENIQRRDLQPLEEAEAFQALLDTGRYSIRTLAERIGKDKSYVQDRLHLLKVPSDVQEAVAAGAVPSLRAAREVAALPTPEERAPLIAEMAAGATATEIREKAREARGLPPPPPRPAPPPASAPVPIPQRPAAPVEDEGTVAYNHLRFLAGQLEVWDQRAEGREIGLGEYTALCNLRDQVDALIEKHKPAEEF